MNQPLLSNLIPCLLGLMVFSSSLKAQQTSCIPPSNFRQASVLEGKAGLVWEQSGSSTRWRVVWGAAGVAPENMTYQLEVYSPQAIIPVSPGTPQMAYLQSVCGSRGSSWIGPITVHSNTPCTKPATLNASSDTICGHASALLSTSGAQQAVWWYAGLPQNYGDNYSTDSLLSDRTYWVTPANKSSDPQMAGPGYDIQAGHFANFSNGQFIRVLDTLLLDSVTLVSNGPTDYFIEIWNANQNNLLQRSPSKHLDRSGEHRVNVGMALIPGQYVIKVSVVPGGGSLFRSTQAQSYPYVLPGLLSIDSTTVGPVNRFYYLYDLSVRTLCIGSASSAHVSVGTAGYAGSDVSDTLCIGDSTVVLNDLITDAQVSHNGYWQWANTRDTVEWIDLSRFDPGDKYTFHYISPGSHNCADTATYVLSMLKCELSVWRESEILELTVFPNPTSSFFTLELDRPFTVEHLSISTMGGQRIREFTVDSDNLYFVGDLPSGIYVVHTRGPHFSKALQLQID